MSVAAVADRNKEGTVIQDATEARHYRLPRSKTSLRKGRKLRTLENHRKPMVSGQYIVSVPAHHFTTSASRELSRHVIGLHPGSNSAKQNRRA